VEVDAGIRVPKEIVLGPPTLNVMLDDECRVIVGATIEEISQEVRRGTVAAAVRTLIRLGGANKNTMDLVWRTSAWLEGMKLGEIEVKRAFDKCIHQAMREAIALDPSMQGKE
jgi:hypothetical protein